MRSTPLTISQILTWADAYFQRKSEWPTHKDGPIPEAPGESWRTVDKAMRNARRGFLVKSSLAQFLAEHRGVRNVQRLPPLTTQHILTWADAHRKRTGQWPTAKSGDIEDAPGEVWVNIDTALTQGLRTLPAGSSLSRLLEEHRGARNIKNLPQLTLDRILVWVDSHHERTGRWPTRNSGQIADSPGESWANIDQALVKGLRGLDRGSSLARLLAEHRSVRNIQNLPLLSVNAILRWIEAHRVRRGRWPNGKSGAIDDAPGENWLSVENALRHGLRGLPGGSSLARLIREHCGVPS